MIVVKDESKDVAKAVSAVCDECGEIKPGRVVSVGKQMLGGKRGSYFFCYECHKPKLYWKKSQSGSVFISSAAQHTLAPDRVTAPETTQG